MLVLVFLGIGFSTVVVWTATRYRQIFFVWVAAVPDSTTSTPSSSMITIQRRRPMTTGGGEGPHLAAGVLFVSSSSDSEDMTITSSSLAGSFLFPFFEVDGCFPLSFVDSEVDG